MKKLTALIILDGFGIGEDYFGNAVSIAKTPNFDIMMKKYSNTLLSASGEDVGLPDGQMGNSEVGHANIGAGRTIYQELTRINKEIREDKFYQNKKFNDVIDYVTNNDKTLHLFGLLSCGGVHSHFEHLYALLKLCKEKNVKDVKIHCFMDGRDVAPKSGEKYIECLQKKINELKIGSIASIMGRYYAMDRDKRWERVEEAYNALTKGIGNKETCPVKVIQDSYENNITDEFIKPTLIGEKIEDFGIVKPEDGIIFYNFRPDRAREITRAFVDKDFNEFEREFLDVRFVTMTQYDETIENLEVAYMPEKINNTFGEYVSNCGLKQLRIAETEKYAHVTFFFNGGKEEPYEGEDRILIPSPKVDTYDMVPEMSAKKVKNEAIEMIESGKYDLIVLNFANPDMVGHTGDFGATVEAVEFIDKCLGEIVNVIIKSGGRAFVTSDHGNCERMIEEDTGYPVTSHTNNKVPFIIIDKCRKYDLKEDGTLADIAPTLLEVMDLKKPNDMTGQSLIVK